MLIAPTCPAVIDIPRRGGGDAIGRQCLSTPICGSGSLDVRPSVQSSPGLLSISLSFSLSLSLSLSVSPLKLLYLSSAPSHPDSVTLWVTALIPKV